MGEAMDKDVQNATRMNAILRLSSDEVRNQTFISK